MEHYSVRNRGQRPVCLTAWATIMGTVLREKSQPEGLPLCDRHRVGRGETVKGKLTPRDLVWTNPVRVAPHLHVFKFTDPKNNKKVKFSINFGNTCF